MEYKIDMGPQQPPPQMVTVNPRLQPVIIEDPASIKGRPNFSARTSRYLGICQFFIGIIVTLVALIYIKSDLMDTVTNYGELGLGIFFAITGIVGICASRTKTTALIMATMVCSMVSAVGVVFLIPGPIINLMNLNEYAENIQVPSGVYFVFIVDLFVQVTEFVIAPVHVAICCKAVCCQPQKPIVYYPGRAGLPSHETAPLTNQQIHTDAAAPGCR